jgi:plasmid stabilization system protein ParE
VRVSLSPRALSDLDRIRKYIAKSAGSQAIADRYLDRLLDACKTLAYSAKRYPPYHIASTWRMMPFENYLVLFVIHKDEVRISHFRHAARKPFRN